MSACRFSTATGRAIDWPTSMAPAASERIDFMLEDWVVDEIERR